MSWFKGDGQAQVSAMPVSKRLFDIVLALVLLVPLSFVIAGFALLLLIVQGRPIFTPPRAWSRRRAASPI